MNLRENTKQFKIGNKIIGGNNKILIQSMCDIKTSNVAEVAKQINECEALGADLMRVSVFDEDDAKAIKEIKKLINIPLVADIHFDYRLAIRSAENGIAKVRINPGNIGGQEKVRLVADCLKAHHVPVRIGVNSGSLEKEILARYGGVTPEGLVESGLNHARMLEAEGFRDIVISYKASNVRMMVEACRLADLGQDVQAVADHITAIRLTANQVATVENLEYLRRVGRVTASSAFFGNLFGVKPILISDALGRNFALKKIKGALNARRELAAMTARLAVKPEEQTLYISHADSEAAAIQLRDLILQQAPFRDCRLGCIGPIVGASVGPGTLAVYFFGQTVTTNAEEAGQ